MMTAKRELAERRVVALRVLVEQTIPAVPMFHGILVMVLQ